MQEGGRSPEPGDRAVCLRCGGVVVVGADLAVRPFTDLEIDELCGDPEAMDDLAQHVRAISLVHLDWEGKRRFLPVFPRRRHELMPRTW